MNSARGDRMDGGMTGVAGSGSGLVSLAEIRDAARRLERVAVRTPLIPVARLEPPLLVKPESLQPTVCACRRLCESGVLGNLLAVRAAVGEYLPGWHRYEDYRQGYAARADLGGGVILSQIHEFDYLYALFGKAKRLFSVGGHWSNLEIDVEDVANTLMECEFNGRPLPVHLHQDYLQRPSQRQCEVIGDAGKAILDLTTLSVTLYGAGGELADRFACEALDRNQLFLDEMKHFLECVRTRSKPVVDLHEGTWSLRLALAAKESIASRGVVELS